MLRDGRHLIGVLRSFDAFSNLVLADTVERRHVGKVCTDVRVGLYVVRADNMVLLGQVDPEREKRSVSLVPLDEFQVLIASEQGKAALAAEPLCWEFDNLAFV